MISEKDNDPMPPSPLICASRASLWLFLEKNSFIIIFIEKSVKFWNSLNNFPKNMWSYDNYHDAKQMDI